MAHRAGVSVATVSKVINNRYGVAQETYSRVQAVIDELGYETSLVAQSLRSHQTNVIGILVTDLEPFTSELLKGAATGMHDTGYELVVYSASGLGQDVRGWERRYLSRISGTLTDGVILVAPSVVDAPHSGPLVAVDPHLGASNLPTVDADNLKGARLATEYLIGMGHQRIGFLAGRSDLESARLREQGYRDALADAGIAFDPALVQVGEFQPVASARAAKRLLDQDPRPTAIFAANDLSAIETVKVAQSRGLSVPEDLAVIGFDNIPESALCSPPLTTVDQSIQRMGLEAVRMLIRLIKGEQTEPARVTLPTELVIRQSSSPPAIPRPRRRATTRTP
ncbi:MAG TPA: LacI family DNA-binding transcriptional regulator [Micromonosporaceae bacterium]